MLKIHSILCSSYILYFVTVWICLVLVWAVQIVDGYNLISDKIKLNMLVDALKTQNGS